MQCGAGREGTRTRDVLSGDNEVADQCRKADSRLQQSPGDNRGAELGRRREDYGRMGRAGLEPATVGLKVEIR